MITQSLIENITKFSSSQSETYGVPSLFQLSLSKEKGQILAIQLKSDKKIVLVGTLLMDCMLGPAFKAGKMQEHVIMSVSKANEILSKDSDITDEEKINILKCVEQHHGVKKFYSLEAEICSNADCYRFASVTGFLGSLAYGPNLSFDARIKLLSDKADEKWNLITLDSVKRELVPQYQSIKNLLKLNQ
ncbi:hypothetical protein COY90_05210 [Candidatus Roizmanbacteria bacterium CG_4_10_14_0_8_um_filter_39_9]|uniref:HD domain-containing protein n=1 Tax=Candidatus Roizmanbacteria bacterium CG_4_10_14_0_8_um_filter_39_9 TaxID=1974829 RepID=A0A2M7QBG4_9BACT|nr:MAG: hypothetical protein COY90_05210 [Candidatus Roizmanbacteria bacterium CG_4_10_14_0_8_um_filter_39_9]